VIDPDWRTRYAAKLKSREAALAAIPRGATIFLGTGSAEPGYLLEGLEERADGVVDAEILHFIALGSVPSTGQEFARRIRHNAFFVGESTRHAVAEGRADYTPVSTSELPDLFRRRKPRVDVALVQVTPPDRHGHVSLGVSVDVTQAAVLAAQYVVAEVNAELPRTFGDSFLKMDRIDALVEHDSALIEYPPPDLGEVAKRIGLYVSALVRDGSTVQVGMGDVPNAIAALLKDKRDLGVHSEMIADWLVDLVESGAVTNAKKTLHPGKVIASLAIGSKRLFDFVDDNPGVEFHPSSYTNDPKVIERNDLMVSINTAFQVDLTGQVCSDSLEHGFFGGISGQVDFTRGAARSRGGKSIIALASTAKGGTISKIVPQLEAGAGVIIGRGAVRYIATEWGCADLQGLTIRERAMALIEVAHPRFREELLAAAKELHYVYPDQVIPTAPDLYPGQYEHCATFGNAEVLFRPVKVTDDALLKDLFYRLSDQSILRRYFTLFHYLPHERRQKELNLDYQKRMGLAAFLEAQDRVEMIGFAQYVVDPATDLAEMAFVVRDDWQRKGIGWHLVQRLVAIARDRGIKGVSATVMAENRAMLHLFQKLGFRMQTQIEGGAFTLEFEI